VSSFQTLFDLIGELARRRHQAAERSFAALGLNHTEARLLSLLHHVSGGAPQEELSSMLTVDRSNTVRALQRLEQEGFILRRKDETDKRANFVRITGKGRKAVVEIVKVRKRIAESFFGDLNNNEARVIVELLRKALPDEVD